jgi:hypothetical protein
MKNPIYFLGHQDRGNSDNVYVIVEVPCDKEINPDLLFQQKSLILYGRRNGKLRCKTIQYLESSIYRYRAVAELNYMDKSYLYKTKQFAKVREQVEQRLVWEMLKA